MRSILRCVVGVFVVVIMGATNGCGGERGAGANPQPTDPSFAIETIAVGLSVPWDLAFLPDGRILVTERAGRIRVIEGGALREEPWAVLDVAATGEAGLMSLALSPDFADNRLVYVVGSFEASGTLVNRILTFTDHEGRGTGPRVIVDGIPAASLHAGAALAFGPDGMLYTSAGDARDPDSAQDTSNPAGSVLRYRPDGGIPTDNPFPGSPVWALGLRNVQGLDWHPDGALFATEHGPSGAVVERGRRDQDELNVIRRGGNYGWPHVSGMESDDRFLLPLTEWTPAIAPAGLAVLRSEGGEADTLPWRGNVFVAALRGQHLRRIVVEPDASSPVGWRVVREETVVTGIGRVRGVKAGPDGSLYFTSSNRDGRGRPAAQDDRIFRITPVRRP